MKIAARLFSLLRNEFQTAAVEVEAPGPLPVREWIDLAATRLGARFRERLLEGGSLRKGTLFLVDGRNVLLLDGLETTLTDRVVISIFPPAGGG